VLGSQLGVANFWALKTGQKKKDNFADIDGGKNNLKIYFYLFGRHSDGGSAVDIVSMQPSTLS
jgi:hypothetical protein